MTVDLLHRAAPPVASEAPAGKLVAIGLGKRYGPVTALEPTDLSVGAGELMTVLGPSGSGKTTLLQVLCGLIEPSTGRLFIDGRDQTHTPAHRRDMGVVFQNYALFPHLTVAENVAFALELRRVPGPERSKRVTEALELVGLGALGRRFPRELSGGQQQRVALARCLVYRPSVILMDEPLGALDRKLRETMQIEVKRLHRQTGATIVLVTHDQEEALALSDRICLMNHGRVEQIGTPQDLYDQPRSLFAAEFVGISNILRGTLQGQALVTPDGTVPVAGPLPGAPGSAAALVIRPEHVTVGEPGLLRGSVVETVFAGSETRVLVALGSGVVMATRRAPGLPPLALGDVVGLHWSAAQGRLLPVGDPR